MGHHFHHVASSRHDKAENGSFGVKQQSLTNSLFLPLPYTENILPPSIISKLCYSIFIL
jgi:hypothetical protein